MLLYDKAENEIYYANAYGVLERNGWFQFSDSVQWADGTPADANKNQYGYALVEGILYRNSLIYDFLGRLCYLQANGAAAY